MFYDEKIIYGQTLLAIKAKIRYKCLNVREASLAYETINKKFHYYNGIDWVPLINPNDLISSGIPVVKFGASLPQTNAAQALSTILNPVADKTIVVVLDVDKGDMVTHLFTSSGWVTHRDQTGTTNHFDFTPYATKQLADADAVNKNDNDLVYVSGDSKLYYVNSSKQLMPINTMATSQQAVVNANPFTDTLKNKLDAIDMITKQDNVGWALVDIDNDGNDDVYNKLGHKLMLTDASGTIIPVTHSGQATPKSYSDDEDAKIKANVNTLEQQVSAINSVIGTVPMLDTPAGTSSTAITNGIEYTVKTDANEDLPIGSFVEVTTDDHHGGKISIDAIVTSDVTTSWTTVDDDGDHPKRIKIGLEKTAGSSPSVFDYKFKVIELDSGANINTSAKIYKISHKGTITNAPALVDDTSWKTSKQNSLTTTQQAVVDANPFTTTLKTKLDSIDLTQYVVKSVGDASFNIADNAISMKIRNHSQLAIEKDKTDATKTNMLMEGDVVQLTGKDATQLISKAINLIDTTSGTAQPYMATTDFGAVSKKMLDSRQAKLLPTPADPTAETALLVEDNVGSIYEGS